MKPKIHLDTTVFVDRFGGDESHRNSASHVLGSPDVVKASAVTTEVVQEVMTVFSRRGQKPFAIQLARQITGAHRIVGTDTGTIEDAIDLMQANDGLLGSDSVVLAAALRDEADFLVTRDKKLGAAAGEIWIDPSDDEALLRLVSAFQ